MNDRPGTDSRTIYEQVVQARAVQRERFHGQSGMLNGTMASRQIGRYCKLAKEAELLLKTAIEEMGLSARAHDKILRVSRMIADLAGNEMIDVSHLTEVINYRAIDRTCWAH